MYLWGRAGLISLAEKSTRSQWVAWCLTSSGKILHIHVAIFTKLYSRVLFNGSYARGYAWRELKWMLQFSIRTLQAKRGYN